MKKKIIIFFVVLFALLGVAFGVFHYLTQPNTSDYFNKKTYLVENTLGLNLDISGMSTDDVINVIKNELNKKQFTLYQDNKVSDVISFKDIEFETNIKELVQDLKIRNDKISGINKFEEHKFVIDISYTIKNSLSDYVVSNLSCIKNYTTSKDAYIVEDDYELKIVKEVYGTEIIEESLVYEIVRHINDRQESLSIDELNIYIKPTILSDNEELVTRTTTYNNLINTDFTYVFDTEKIKLTKEQFHNWITLDENNEVIFDYDAMLAYIKSLAKKYNTFGTRRQFKTTSGKIISVPGGDYGWTISQTKEVAALQQDILSGKSVLREPTWLYKGYGPYFNRDGTDVNNSYVEIDLSTQHLWLYVDGNLITETDLVSGDKSNGWTTPSGVFGITYKQRNATLRGDDYATKVNYWMPFNMNIGMHDATWRNSFGGTIYVNDGSHGCINLPLEHAKIIYGYMDTFFPVIVYNFDELE